jgi:hypothetical protein
LAILDKIETDFFHGSASFRFLKFLDDTSYLSTEDRVIINNILIGCSKLIISYYDGSIMRKGKKASKASKRHLAMLNTISNFAFTETRVIAPIDIRKKLNQDLQGIESSDITHLLKSLIAINVFSKSEKRRKKRGRAVTNVNDYLAPGVKSYYQQTRYFTIIKKIISDKCARALIFFFLGESKLIHRFLYHNIRLILYMVKYDKDSLNIISSTINLEELKIDCKALHEHLKDMDDESVAEVIDRIAVKKTNELAREIKDDDPVLYNLYLFGGLYFYFN